MTPLDTLSAFGSELTAEQLDNIAGGLYWLPAVFCLLYPEVCFSFLY